MKRVIALLTLLGAVAFGAPAWADDKAAAPAAPVATATAAVTAAAADAAAPAAAPIPPNKADNAWVMMSAALVILMSIPGLALFYGGLVRTKNMLSVLMQVFVIFSLISVLWVVYGYSAAFTEGNAYFGTFDKLFLKGITVDSVAATFSKGVNISELAYVIFQGAFAAITCGLIVGAFAERVKFAAVLVFMVIWFTLSYIPMAHMVWYWAGPDAYIDAAAGEAAGKTAGFLFQKGALDFAGGTVVHINAAVAGLVGAYMIGKRSGLGNVSMAPHSLTFTMIGASLLWFGWFGFNAGSALEASGGAALAMVNTWLATACAVTVLDVRRMDHQGQALDAGCRFRCRSRSGGDHPGRRFRRRHGRDRHRSARRHRLPVGCQWPEEDARRRRLARRLRHPRRRRHPRRHPDRRLRRSGPRRHGCL